MKSKTKVKKDKKTKTKNKNKQRQKQKQSVVVNIDNSRKTVAKNKGEKQQAKASPSIIPQPIYVPQYAPQSFQQNQPAQGVPQPFRAEPTRPTVFNPSGSVFNNSNFSVPDDDDISTLTAGSGYSSMPSMKSMASASLPTLQTIPKPSGVSVSSSSAFNPSPSVGGSFRTAIEPMAEDLFNSPFKEFNNAYEVMPTSEREIGTSTVSFLAEPKNPPSALAIELNDNIETAPDNIETAPNNVGPVPNLAEPKDAKPTADLTKPPRPVERQFVRARGETKKTEPETAQPSESQPVPNADGKSKRAVVYNNGQCVMVNNKGQPCKGVVKPGEIYCATHRKMTDDERADIINKQTMRKLKKLKSSGGV